MNAALLALSLLLPTQYLAPDGSYIDSSGYLHGCIGGPPPASCARPIVIAPVSPPPPPSPPPLTMEEDREAVIAAGEAHCRRWPHDQTCHALKK